MLPNPCGVLSRPTVSSSVDSSWRLDLSPSFYRCFLHRLNSPPSSVAADAAVGGGGGGYGGHSPFCPFSPAIKELCVPAPAESAPNALFLGCVKVLRLAARHFYSARSSFVSRTAGRRFRRTWRNLSRDNFWQRSTTGYKYAARKEEGPWSGHVESVTPMDGRGRGGQMDGRVITVFHTCKLGRFRSLGPTFVTSE